MATSRLTKKLWAAAVAAVSVGGAAMAQAPKAEAVLARLPGVPGVNVTTPAASEMASCKAEVRQWEAGKDGVKPKGVIVTDAAGRKLRQFIDTTGGDKWNILSYFVEGVEAFREVDNNGNGKPDVFRWLGVNGGKQGVDANEDGVIDQWLSITAEEVSHEVFAAVAAKDAGRLRAVLATEKEIKAIGLPPAEEARLLKKLAAAEGKLVKANADLKLAAKAKLVHVEMDVPHTTPRDGLGTAEDLVKHRNVGLLVDASGDGKDMKYMSAGEMVQIGRTWKLIDGPSAGLTGGDDTVADAGVTDIPEGIRDAVAELGKVPPPKDAGDMARYHLARAVILEKCVAGTSGAAQLPWLKQMVDSYAAGVEASPDNADAVKRFRAWNDSIQKGGADETKAYTAFRFAAAEYAVKLKEAGTDPTKMQAVQGWRKESLEGYVKAHPASADAPEAIMQLAITAEFDPKGEKAAVGWYEKVIKEFAGHPHAAKATGAIKRLGCEGKPFELSGETIDGQAFSEKALAGKPAVVLWWASWGTNSADELKNLAKLEKEFAAKGLTVVTVILDDESTKATAAALVKASGVGGYHLYAAGGLDRSPLAAAYGIHGIPHVFLVGKDGKVADRAAEYGPRLKDEVEALFK
jgi:thiol-disulfide isomerase/thioredoxin